MEFVLYFFVAGFIAVFMILKFEIKQSSKLNTVLKETKTVQPLFMQRAAEQKLITLNTQLYGSMAVGLNALPTGRVNMNEGARQLVASQLNKLVSSYNTGQITLREYNNKLSELIKMVNEVKGMSFEGIKS